MSCLPSAAKGKLSSNPSACTFLRFKDGILLLKGSALDGQIYRRWPVSGGSQTHLYACQLAKARFLNTLSVFMVVVWIGTGGYFWVLILGWKMAKMGQKTDGGFGILAGFLEEKTQSWYQSKTVRKQTGQLWGLTGSEGGWEGVMESSSLDEWTRTDTQLKQGLLDSGLHLSCLWRNIASSAVKWIELQPSLLPPPPPLWSFSCMSKRGRMLQGHWWELLIYHSSVAEVTRSCDDNCYYGWTF